MEKSTTQAEERYQRLDTKTGKYCLFDGKTNALISEKKTEGPYKNVRVEETPDTLENTESFKEPLKPETVAAPKTKKSKKKSEKATSATSDAEASGPEKKTAADWLKSASYELITKTGWNDLPAEHFQNQAITKEEFDARLALCSVRPVIKLK